MSSYQTAWLVYGLFAAGALAACAQLLKYRYVRSVRTPVLLFGAALLLTPVHMPEQAGWYAPAVMGAAIGLLDEGPDAMIAMLETPLAIGLTFILGWAVVRLLGWLYCRWRAKQTVITEEPEQESNHEV